MDFARKQLEKYGWSEGKGLGKHENGISQPLKPKLKRSITGVGYDAAADLTEQWWSALYNKAANNVEVEEKNGKTKKIKTKSNEQFEITNSTWKLNKKKGQRNEHEEEYSDTFVKTAVLTSGGCKTEKVIESESEEENVSAIHKITDEQLFAACEGRTAHKGARHGLKALGKLARIEEQEKLLLQQPKYNGYSHKKHKDNIKKVVEEINLSSDSEKLNTNKKKKKHCNDRDFTVDSDKILLEKEPVDKSKKMVKENNLNTDSDIPSKRKKSDIENGICVDNVDGLFQKAHVTMTDKNRKVIEMELNNGNDISSKRRKKKKQRSGKDVSISCE